MQPPSEAQEILNALHNMVLTEENGGAASGSGLQQTLEAFVHENHRLRIQNLTLVKEIDGGRKENERLRSENAALARELQGFKGSPSPDLVRPKLEVEEVTGNSSSSSFVSDGCLNFDVAKRILVALEELPVYVSYVDANLRRIWSDDSMSDFNKEVLFHIETAGVRLKLKALETGKPQTEDVAIHLPNKDHMVWWVNATPHFNEEGTVIGVSMVAVNITEQVKLKECLRRLEAEMAARRAMEEELCQAMKLTEDAIQAKNVFLAVMSHEIRTPLNGLLGLAEALETSELNVEQKELVRTIMSSSVMVADILGDILDLATMEFGMMKFEEKPFCPADLVQDVTKMALAATQEKDITVTSEIADDIPKMVCCDPLRVRQVIKYLVLNAIKFTQKGTVSIRMRVKPDPGRKVGLGTENEMKLSEHLHSMENNNTVTGVESDQHSKSAQSSSRSRNSFIDLLDMNLFQMKLLEISRSSKNEIRCAVDVSNNVRDAQRNGEKLVRLGREDTILVPVNPSTVTGQSGLLLDTSSRRKGSLKHTNFEDCSASEDVETSENELCDQHLLYCEITDTGVGIAKEVFTSLFGEFTHVNDGLTRNYGGTGLGLVICRQLVELMGGQLTVESEVGNGFKFAFTVKCKVLDGTPVEMTCRRLEMSSSTTLKSTGLTSESILACTEGQSIIARKADFVSKLENNRTGGSPRILLAEDNKVNVMVAISMLKRLGFTAKVVTNGLEALEAIRKEKYDLILLDICMPLMDGLQVAYAVRKFEETGQWPDGDLSNMFSNSHSWSLDSGNTSLSQVQMNNMDGLANAIKDLTTTDPRNHIPIIAVTANALRSEIEKCFACGMDAFIAKPVVFQKLREILEIYLPQNNSQLT